MTSSPLAVNCVSVPADETYLVPHKFDGKHFNSGSGEYYYRKTSCPYFVVDIYLNNQSNGQTAQARASGVLITVGSSDLPSSADHDKSIPIVKWDCTHLSEVGFFYKRTSLTPQFTPIGTVSVGGIWSKIGNPTCQVAGNNDLTTSPPPVANEDIYRAAIRVKERGSGQEAGVTVSTLPPG